MALPAPARGSQSGAPVARPRATAPAVASGRLVPLDPCPPFVFLHHPHRWDVAIIGDKPTIVPALRRFEFRGGRSGVVPIRGHAVGDASEALAARERMGWQQIPATIGGTAFGEPFTDYCVGYEGTRGDVHLSVWERPIVLGTRCTIEHDADPGYDVWRASLVGKVIEPPNAPALAALRAHLSAGYRRRASRTTNASSLASAELFKAKLVALDPPKRTPRKPAPAPDDAKET